NVLKRQADWIGRSEGAFVDFTIVGSDFLITDSAAEDDEGQASRKAEYIRVFTTRIDTIYGANAVVVAAEHPVVVRHINELSNDVLEKIQQIRSEKMNPSDHETEAVKDGVDTGLRALNPFSGEELPVWIGNYVMMEYGTGAVMSVPGHDERDLDFAKKFGLPIKEVIVQSAGFSSSQGEQAEAGTLNGAFTDHGILINSEEWSGKTSEAAKSEMAAYAEEHGFGKVAITFRLRDWGISRQRFWGSPIPIVYCDKCGTVPEKYPNLPVRLPESAPFTGTGESPLAKVPSFVETACPNCDGPARRETDTMDTFVDSSWYFFRYTDPENPEIPFETEKAAYWTPVDQYVGGDDHAVMHLIYTRFWTKVMRDLGLVKFDEPVTRLLTQGMVVGETFFDDTTGKRIYAKPEDVTVERDAKGKVTAARGVDGRPLKWAIERMSKSKGNGVDPDEMIDIYGADAARLFVLFAAPVENELVWQESGIEGAVRFLQRVWRMVWKWNTALAGDRGGERPGEEKGKARDLRRKTHQTIHRIEQSLESLQFNTPVAALMELANSIQDLGVVPDKASSDELYAVREALTSLVLMLTPFSPHSAEELFSVLSGKEEGILASGARFPAYDARIAAADEIEIPVQVNGKLRSRISVPPDIANEQLEALALADEKVREYTAEKEVIKVVVVPKRLVSVVIKG
ncbi:MAG: leucine--tRNA ligase, partial [Acidobacteriota bacterium]